MYTEIDIFDIFYLNRIFYEFVTEIQMSWQFCTKSTILNFWPKSKLSQHFDRNWDFPKFWRKLKSFENVKKSIFFVIFYHNRNFSKFWPKSRLPKFLAEIDFFFRKRRPKTRLSKFLTEIEFFSKILTEIEIFQIEDRNRILLKNFDWNTYLKILNEIQIFRNFYFTEIRGFRYFLRKSKFFRYFDQNLDFRNVWPKLRCFENSNRNRNFRNL